MFDSIAIVDWSAAGTASPARPSADAIWVGVAGAEPQYFRTRLAAEAWLAGWSAAETAAGRRVLIGFDFPMGYPAGFALRLTGMSKAQAVWAWLADRIVDGPDNANNRFDVAAAINRSFGKGGPFWGCPAGKASGTLHPRKQVDYPGLGLPERRAVEQIVPRAQPVWKLFTTGSVGSQMLMGLPLIHRMAQQRGVSVWPFDAVGPVTLAEVYPSLLAGAVQASNDAIKDRAQVRILAKALAALARTGQLAGLFDAPDIAREEGWILGAGHAALLERSLPERALTWN